MKSVLIIGLGHFGYHLCLRLSALGNEIMIVDKDERRLTELLPYVVNSRIGDCTDVQVLKSLGVQDFDLCFVCLGDDFLSCLEITSELKDMGAKYVVSKASEDRDAKFLLRNGADEVVYPDRDIAEKVAVTLSSDSVFDYVELTDEYSIYEITPLPKWIGRTIKEIDIRNKYGINIIGIKGKNMSINPSPDYVFNNQEHLLVIGAQSDLDEILKKM